MDQVARASAHRERRTTVLHAAAGSADGRQVLTLFRHEFLYISHKLVCAYDPFPTLLIWLSVYSHPPQVYPLCTLIPPLPF